MFSSVDEATRFIAEEGVEFVDVRFCDLPGVMQHFSIPIATFDKESLDEGLMFDGSSIRGFTKIHESDMKLMPDLSTAFIDPFRKRKTLVLNFFVVDPFTGEPYSRDPRNIAKRAEEYLRSTGIADTVYFGAEAEFYIFDDIRFDDLPHRTGYAIDSREAWWNTGKDEEPNLGYKTRVKGGYFPVSPNDQMADLRDEMTAKCQQVGLQIERAHHEVGVGQQEINYRFDTLLAAADDVMKFKYVIKNTAFEAGRTATFMPKPLFGDAGSGMHCHQSLWKDGQPLFHDERGYGGLSDIARWYIGGLLAHAPSLLAFTNPSVNSFHRLVPGFEAPVNLVYSARNRSACTRIPVTGSSAKAKRIEYRTPDASSNPYLAFAAQLMAGLDGIRNRIEPPAPIDKDLYELPPEEHADIEQLPQSLEDALRALEEDHDYLTEGGVFDEDIIETWIAYKRDKEIEPLRQRPHPYEFTLYYDL
ncbi:type I glutamate--ammonia ligase [Trueperella pyogenes]|uniref:Glutamine synthetase n=1 Tax=Trueperella pyogenes TaxID=1661 RepID=A0A2S0RKU3_9ACTO|nr:type I glutamate--ammonia ligase [Trueperella pyogenes]AJC69702.1 glutamine synthetase [Trueperella pyogenes TP8]ALD74355.1 glutamine synthetase [Trueperella pyogenes]AWA42738.1 type I glutamate--ammonia ligase [Trueperella pyogenes]AWG04764.1 type I glutamate--ammonia ligase [Trueperella pyogenes]AWG15590.1 type I glutamate--ammonia ligase [Trueperella pyogenes]